MNRCYDDILALTNEEPKWFDENAVPRYCAFHPSKAADIYAEEVALLEIECQSCGHKFIVAMSSHGHQFFDGEALSQRMKLDCDLNYKDPPNIECCPSGPTMNSIPLKVIEFWTTKNNRREWTRNHDLEVDIRPDWAND